MELNKDQQQAILVVKVNKELYLAVKMFQEDMCAYCVHQEVDKQCECGLLETANNAIEQAEAIKNES